MTQQFAATSTPYTPDVAQHDLFEQQTVQTSVDEAELRLRIQRLTESPSYRQADEDLAFLPRPEMCGVRLQLDYWKAEELPQRHQIDHTIVVYGGTRLAEPGVARHRFEDARRALDAAQEDPGTGATPRLRNAFWKRVRTTRSPANSVAS